MNLVHIMQNCVEIKDTLNLLKVREEINKVLNEPSLYSDMPRKSYKQRKKENWQWYFKNKEACVYYNSYGFDIEGFRNQDDYIPYRQFRIERFRENLRTFSQVKYDNKLCILRDKITFSAYFGTLLGEKYVVKSVGKIFSDGKVFNLGKNSYTTLSELLKQHDRLFLKKMNGECGEGCYLIDSETALDEFEKTAAGSEYLIQDVLLQHDAINEINASCINTVRIITIAKSGEPKVFAHYMRFGGGDAINDNRATGGMGVAISDDGKLQKVGVGHHAVSEIHPKSKAVYYGREIPFWNEVKELVVNAHRLIPEIPTIGWDVAITPDGPVLIEGNDNWEISGAQDTTGGLKKKWYELRKK